MAASTSIHHSDSILEEIAKELKKFSLGVLDEDWVNDVWISQFTEVKELPMDYDEDVLQVLGVKKILQLVTKLIHSWIEERKREKNDIVEVSQDGLTSLTIRDSFRLYDDTAASSSASAFWSKLNDLDIRIRNLIALIFYFMDKGLKLDATSRERDLCIYSTSLYFVLLALPGSGAYKIFHPVLYNRALDTLKLPLKLDLAKYSPKKKRNKNQKLSQAVLSQGSKLRKRRASSTSSHTFNENDLADESDDDIESGVLSSDEAQQLIIGLNSVIYYLLVLLDHCPLKRSTESLEETIQILVDITHLEAEYANLDFNMEKRRSGLSGIAFNSYIGLEKICRPLHGKVRQSVLLSLKYLLPGVLMTHKGSSEISGRGLTVIREHTLHFVKRLLTLTQSDCFEPMQIFIQHLALQVPDRSEFRQKTALAIMDLMKRLPGDMYKSLVKWFIKFAHHEKGSHRLFSVEMLGKFLQEDEIQFDKKNPDIDQQVKEPPSIQPNTENPGNKVAEAEAEIQSAPNELDLQVRNETLNVWVSHKFLFGVVFSRCRDISANVRTKALQTLAEITATNNQTMYKVLHSMLEELDAPESAKQQQSPKHICFEDLIIETSDHENLTKVNPLPSAQVFLDILRKRALDEAASVRKSALQVVSNILLFSEEFLSEKLLNILCEHCRDSSLMIRKQMIASFTEVLKKYPTNEKVIRLWVSGIFPLVLDAEQRSAEKAMESIWDCLFGNLRKYSETQSPAEHSLPWKILNQSELQSMTNYLQRACGIWAKEGVLKSNILLLLRTHVGTENNDHSWLLLRLITVHLPLHDPHFVMEYFNSSIHTPQGVGLYTLLQVLRVLFSSVVRLSRDEQILLQKDLILLVERFAIPPELIPTAVDIATVVCDLEAKKEHRLYQTKVDECFVNILNLIDDELSQKILNPGDMHISEDARMLRQIFTLGEIAQICPTKVKRRLFLLLQSIIFPVSEDPQHKGKKQRYIPSSQTQSSQPPQCGFTPSTRLRAVSIITLAKMCIQEEDMAKKMVPAFGRLLDTSPDVAIKNNVMYALTDMCKRYANLVDPLIPQITACLKDKSLTVRETTITTLIHLLQEDYLKMSGRGAFFFRIVQTLNDSNEKIRKLSMFYIQRRLLKRKPKIMYHHFIEAIFHFNEYELHEKYNKFNVSDREKQLFSLKGHENKENRHTLYKFMLENMTDEDRFQTTYRLCQDILNGVVEGGVTLDDNSYGLLQDTFHCISSEEIKLASLKSKVDDEDEVAEDDMKGALMVAAKQKIISQVVKKNVIENIIPIIIALKHKLEEQKSKLLDDLMNCLRELMKDYKNEVKDILAGDKQLATEIEYDLKKWEEEQKKLEARQESEVDIPASAQQNEEVIRVFLESAVTSIKQQMKVTEEKKKSQEEENLKDNGAAPETQPHHLQTFLESNNALDSDKIPENLTHMLSPNVVVENIGPYLKSQGTPSARRSLMPDIQASNQAEGAKDKEQAKSKIAPNPSATENQNEERNKTMEQDKVEQNEAPEQGKVLRQDRHGENPEKDKLDVDEDPEQDKLDVDEDLEQNKVPEQDEACEKCDVSEQDEAPEKGETPKNDAGSEENNKNQSEEVVAAPENEKSTRNDKLASKESEEVKNVEKTGPVSRDISVALQQVIEEGDEQREQNQDSGSKKSSDNEDEGTIIEPKTKELTHKHKMKKLLPVETKCQPKYTRAVKRKATDNPPGACKKAKTPNLKTTQEPNKASKLKANFRAISTPNRGEVHLLDNVTFLENSQNLSAIPVLSPQTPKTRKSLRIKAAARVNETSVSFRHGEKPKDLFEEVAGKTPSSKKRTSKSKK